MGWFDDAVAFVASGGISSVVSDEANDKMKGLFSGFFSGGASDVYSAVQKYRDMLDKGASTWEAIAGGIDRGIDPGGSVDTIIRGVGDLLPDSWKQYMQPAGATVGGIVGSYVPVIGTVAGAAIGSGIGSKLAGEKYSTSLLKSGISAATAGATKGIGEYFGGAPKGGPSPGYADAAAGGSGSIMESAGLSPIMADQSLQLASTLQPLESFSTDSLGTVMANINTVPQFQVDPMLTAPTVNTSNLSPMGWSAVHPTSNMFDYAHVKKVLSALKSANSMLGGTGGQLVPGGAVMTQTGNPSDIDTALMQYRHMIGESGVSKVGKAKIFSDFEIPKVNDDLYTLITRLKNYNENKGGL